MSLEVSTATGSQTETVVDDASVTECYFCHDFDTRVLELKFNYFDSLPVIVDNAIYIIIHP